MCKSVPSILDPAKILMPVFHVCLRKQTGSFRLNPPYYLIRWFFALINTSYPACIKIFKQTSN
jgi:hypothetical protein